MLDFWEISIEGAKGIRRAQRSQRTISGYLVYFKQIVIDKIQLQLLGSDI